MAKRTFGNQRITRAGLTTALQSKPRKTRAMRRPKDIFRRLYTVWVDLTGPTEGMVGLIERNFTAPIQIPDKYHLLDPEKPWRMHIDFAGYANELRRAKTDWETLGKFHSRRLYADKYIGDTKFTAPVLEIIGPPKMPWELIALTARGDPWCIGQQRHLTPAVEEIKKTWPGLNELVAVPGARNRRAEVPEEFRLPAELEALVGQKGSPVETWQDEEDDESDFDKAMAEYADEEDVAPDFTEDDFPDDEEDDVDMGLGSLVEETDEPTEMTPAQKRAQTIAAKKAATQEG